MNIWRHLALASATAARSRFSDCRTFLLGAVGVRSDGVLVTARNEAALGKSPRAHAEARLARKLDKFATVFVARVLQNGSFAMAKPCPDCLRVLRSRDVQRVYYTIHNEAYGRIDL